MFDLNTENVVNSKVNQDVVFIFVYILTTGHNMLPTIAVERVYILF